MTLSKFYYLNVLCLILFLSTGCNRSSVDSANVESKEIRKEGKEVQEEKVTPLLTENPVADPASEESLRQAALDGIISEVNKYIEAGTSVDALDPDGHTALMFSAFN